MRKYHINTICFTKYSNNIVNIVKFIEIEFLFKDIHENTGFLDIEEKK